MFNDNLIYDNIANSTGPLWVFAGDVDIAHDYTPRLPQGGTKPSLQGSRGYRHPSSRSSAGVGRLPSNKGGVLPGSLKGCDRDGIARQYEKSISY
jgi:hypothetical protein